jgi:hypothetical protein
LPPKKDVNSCFSFTRFSTIAIAFFLFRTIPSGAVDLGNAVIVYPASFSGPEKKAVQMLAEEAEKRTKVMWPTTTIWPSSNGPVIAVCTKALLPEFAPDFARAWVESPKSKGPEGFQISVKRGATNTVVLVVGNDARGVLFGVGRLLREMRLQPRKASVADQLDIATAPKYPLRGHQLGYRPKCNSYDAWDLPVWEQYFRDLAVFGCNSIELIPPRSDDAATSPHFPRPPMEMMAGMSRIADSYGLDVWIWYPAMDPDYSDPKTVESALREWGEVFANLPRIDDVFVPGGDPGHTRPKFLMALLEKETENLHRYHPKARMWVSPQGFNQAWMDEFLDILKRDRPAWLSGLVYGPQIRISLPLPGHYSFPAMPVPGAGLGRGLRCHGSTRMHQSAPGRRGDHLSQNAARHHWFSDVFGRLQRRRQQNRLERTRLGPGAESG